MDALRNAVNAIVGLSVAHEYKDGMEVTSANSLEADVLNRKLVEKGVYVNHLVKKKANLEEQFLELIKN